MSYLERISSAHTAERLTQEEMFFYARHLLLPGIGTRGQLKLKCARVLVIGAGGLGCPALQALAGAGVGELTVVDGDSVALSNLSRQWLHDYKGIGMNKAKSAVRTLAELNPFIQVIAHEKMLDEANAEGLISRCDVVVDATDDIETRYLIDAICAKLNKPWVHAALYRERSQLCVFWSHYGATFQQLFPVKSEAPSCSGAGMIGASAGLIANLQALEVIKLITASAVPKVGELIVFDAGGLVLKNFRFPNITRPIPIAGHSGSNFSISAEQLQQALSIHEPIVLVDLRSPEVFETGSMPGAVNFSAEAILQERFSEELMHADRVVLFCEEGLVSALLVDALKARGQGNVSYLEAGFKGFAI